MRSCEDYIADMNLSIDGLLEPEQEQALQAHLAQCPKCRSLYQSYRDIQDAILESETEPPKGLSHSVMERIHAEKTRHSPKETIKRMRFTLVAAAVALVLVSAGRYIGNPGDHTAASTQASSAAAEAAAVDAADTGEGAAFAPRVAAQSPENAADTAEDQAKNEAGGVPFLGTADAAEAAAESADTDILVSIQSRLAEAGEQGSLYLVSNTEAELQTLLPKAEKLLLPDGSAVYKVSQQDYEAVQDQLMELESLEAEDAEAVYLCIENS